MTILVCAGILTDEAEKIIKQINSKYSINTYNDIYSLTNTSNNYERLLIFSSAINTKQDFNELLKIIDKRPNVEIIVFDKDRSEFSMINDNVTFIDTLNPTGLREIMSKPNNKKSFFSKVFGEKKVNKKQNKNIRSGQIKSGVYCITGHPGIGKSDYISKVGMHLSITSRTVLVDLDVISRGLNNYYTGITENTDENPMKAFGLLKALNHPESLSECVYSINRHLDVLTLSLKAEISREDIVLLDNQDLLKTLISRLRETYDVVLIETSLEKLKYSSCFDNIILLMSNNIHSIYTTANQLKSIFLSDQSLWPKIKNRLDLLIYKYNSEVKFQRIKLNPKNSLQLLNDILGSNSFAFKEVTKIDSLENHSCDLYSDKHIRIFSEHDKMEAYIDTIIRFMTK